MNNKRLKEARNQLLIELIKESLFILLLLLLSASAIALSAIIKDYSPLAFIVLFAYLSTTSIQLLAPINADLKNLNIIQVNGKVSHSCPISLTPMSNRYQLSVDTPDMNSVNLEASYSQFKSLDLASPCKVSLLKQSGKVLSID